MEVTEVGDLRMMLPGPVKKKKKAWLLYTTYRYILVEIRE
jgi:hypothetical protein